MDNKPITQFFMPDGGFSMSNCKKGVLNGILHTPGLGTIAVAGYRVVVPGCWMLDAERSRSTAACFGSWLMITVCHIIRTFVIKT